VGVACTEFRYRSPAHGSVRAAQPISIAPQKVKGSVGLISSLHDRIRNFFGEGEVILSASGPSGLRPPRCGTSLSRYAPGTRGGDVRQLEEALARLGFDPGTVDDNSIKRHPPRSSACIKGWLDPFASTREQRAAVLALEREWSDARRAQLAAEATRETA